MKFIHFIILSALYLVIISGCGNVQGLQGPASSSMNTIIISQKISDRMCDDSCYSEDNVVEDYTWEFDPSQDLQNPELPTGCEATAAATLMRMNGVYVTKTEIADALPKSDSEGQFAYTFWGNPYSQDGWACMSPCIATVLSEFKRDNQSIQLGSDIPLNELPLPCEIWVTMYMSEPWWTSYEHGGYRLCWNPHAIVITQISDGIVYCIDPLIGETQYDYESVNSIYTQLGSQSVYIHNKT